MMKQRTWMRIKIACLAITLLLGPRLTGGQEVSGAGMAAPDIQTAPDIQAAPDLQAEGESQAEYRLFMPVVSRYLGFRAPSGVLDPSFGEDGVVTTSFSGSGTINALAIQRDGKIVAAGWASDSGQEYVALARYNPDGSLDTTFDGDGMVLSSFGGYFRATAVALQPDDKIVVAGFGLLFGSNYYQFFLARYTSAGSLDAGFGSGGWLTTDFYGFDNYADSVAIQPDGMILAGGKAYQGTTYSGAQTDFALARYTPDGSLDTTFDGDGKVTTDFAGKSESGNSLALLPDGKILFTGAAAECPYYCFALARYNPDGSLDTSFDGDGLATADLATGGDYAYSMALQMDGKIVMAGINWEDIYHYQTFALIRFNPDGDVDWDFGTWGKTITDWGAWANAYAIVLESGGKIILAGSAGDAASFAMARYNPDGSLDESFGSAGLYWTEVTGFAYAAALQPDGKIILGGSSNEGFTLARFK